MEGEEGKRGELGERSGGGVGRGKANGVGGDSHKRGRRRWRARGMGGDSHQRGRRVIIGKVIIMGKSGS